MKRIVRIALLLCVFAALLCVCAYAAEQPTTAGIYDVVKKDVNGLTFDVVPDGTLSATAVKIDDNDNVTDFYAGAEKLTVTVTAGADAAQYLILAQSAEGTPTKENIRYIDQKAAENGAITFTVYPDALEKGVTYHIYIAGTGGAKTEIATFRYFIPYMLGDVDKSNDISVNDALFVLQAVAGSRTLDATAQLAADTDHSSDISVNDALFILQAVAGSRTLQ